MRPLFWLFWWYREDEQLVGSSRSEIMLGGTVPVHCTQLWAVTFKETLHSSVLWWRIAWRHTAVLKAANCCVDSISLFCCCVDLFHWYCWLLRPALLTMSQEEDASNTRSQSNGSTSTSKSKISMDATITAVSDVVTLESCHSDICGRGVCWGAGPRCLLLPGEIAQTGTHNWLRGAVTWGTPEACPRGGPPLYTETGNLAATNRNYCLESGYQCWQTWKIVQSQLRIKI